MKKILSLFLVLEKWLRTKRALLIVLVFISFTNISLYTFSNKIKFSKEQVRRDASGFTYSLAKKFTYFNYYTDYFPLATTTAKLKYSKQDALSEINENGKNLIMEYYHWSRLGEHARIWAFLPDAWLKNSPKSPSIHLFNVLVFLISLLILYSGFWFVRKPSCGLFIVVLINLTPFYLFEVFVNQNIFGLLGSTFFMVMGINMFLFFSEKKDLFKVFFLSILTGAIIGFFSEFRNEISIVLLTLIFIYLLLNNFRFYVRIILSFIAFISFSSTKKVMRSHFDTKFQKTIELVGEHGGHVYNGAKINGHNFWHPLFCGLGDFDTKYGYEWNDLIAYKYAIPELNEKYNMNLKYRPGQYHLDQYYDDARKYYIKPEELNHYEIVMKDKVLSDIKNDPLWYLEIIWKRIIRVLTETLPYSYLGFVAIPLLYYLFEQKKWHWIKLIIVSLPLSATSIIIYSGRGTTYNSVFGYFVLLIIVYEVFQFFRKRTV